MRPLAMMPSLDPVERQSDEALQYEYMPDGERDIVHDRVVTP